MVLIPQTKPETNPVAASVWMGREKKAIACMKM